MNAININARLDYEVLQPTSFALSITAARTDHQTVTNENIEFDRPVEFGFEPYGDGTQQLVRFDAPEGPLGISYRATVTVNVVEFDTSSLSETEFRHIPAEVIRYLNPSRYCESDKVSGFTSRHFASVWPGYGRVQAISNWVGANILYDSSVTDGSSSAVDVLFQRAGVCRDYAHVAISLCRALGIPARYVSGYGLGVEPQDFHGFFEAYLSHQWYLFDPTGMAEPNSLARIGLGRDAADVPFAAFVGAATLSNKSIMVDRVDNH